MFVFAGFYISVNVVPLLGATTRLDYYYNFIISDDINKNSICGCRVRVGPKYLPQTIFSRETGDKVKNSKRVLVENPRE